jgi:hypothetical protein
MTARPTRPTRLLARGLGLGITVAIIVVGCVPEPVGRASVAPTSGGPSIQPSASLVPVPTIPPPGASFLRPTPTPLPSFALYTVVRGDTLTRIAKRFSTSARSIAYWNRAAHPSLDPDSPDYHPNDIKVGWTLQLIPGVKIDEEELPEPSASPEASAS